MAAMQMGNIMQSKNNGDQPEINHPSTMVASLQVPPNLPHKPKDSYKIFSWPTISHLTFDLLKLFIFAL